MKLTKSEKYAWLGTVISSIIILLILLLVFLPGIKEEEEGGLMISFGEVEDGSGNSMQPSEAVALPVPPVNTPEDKLLTQDKPSVLIDDSKNKPEEKPVTRPVTTPVVVDNKLEKEEQATQRADDIIGGTFGSGTNQGSGAGTNDAPAGNPLGKGQSGGNSWSLSGRNLDGGMPKPSYNENIEGYIVLNIRVDESGAVISATFSRGTISEKSLIDAAVVAARKTRFTKGKGTVVGTITYNFKLR